jgi:two-component system KDP operon response regulator KdpE
MSVEEPLVAIIEDELPVRRFLRASLKGEGYRVAEAETGQEGLRIVTQENPAVVILDLGLPDRDGLEIIEEVRGWSGVPILVLSAREQERVKIRALDLGANDYLTKPFGIGELLARVRVAIRSRARTSDLDQPERTTFQIGDIEVDLLSRQVTRGGEKIKLTRLEFELLRVLAVNSGRVLTHRFLLQEVWGPHMTAEHHTLRVFISSLRKKLEKDPNRPEFILTDQGVGYRLVCPSD